MSSVTFPVAIGGDGSTVSDDDNATTGLRNGGWRTRFIPCFTNLVNIADYIVSYTAQTSTFAEPPPMGSTTPNTGAFTRVTVTGSTAPTNGMFLPTTNTLAWSTNSTERLRLDSPGNLGLGVTPSGWSGVTAMQLPAYGHITASNTQLNFSVNAYYNGGYKYINTGTASFFNVNNNSFAWNLAPSGTAGNAISFTQAMTLDASGNLLVGATSTIASSKCVITKNNDTQLTLDASNSGSGVFTTLSFANQGTVKTQLYWSSTSSTFNVQNGTGGVYLATNGTSWTSASDERLKTDLKPIENAAQKVSTLRAVTGRFKTDEEGVSRSFLIAQDVQAVLPEAVDASDPDKLGVQYTDTIPLLVAAIKELSVELNLLKQKVNA